MVFKVTAKSKGSISIPPQSPKCLSSVQQPPATREMDLKTCSDAAIQTSCGGI